MLFVPSLTRGWFLYDNFGVNPSATPGTSVVPGASNAEGAWTEVASAANIAQDIYGFWLRVSDGGTTAQIKSHLLDIGVDPAGGTSYSAIISNLVCGATGPAASAGGVQFFFPHFIKAGSSVAVRIQGSNATAGTVFIGIQFYGFRSNPETFPVGTFSETIGAITNSSGVVFTPGNAADGAWVSLGTTSKALWWWQLCYQIDDATMGAESTYIDLGVGDVTNKDTIFRLMHRGTTGETLGSILLVNLIPYAAYCPLPAGVELFVRGRCENAPDSDYNAVAIGIGG